MLLVVDIGNTNIVFGIYYEKSWIRNWRIQTDALKTADEYEVILNSLLANGEIDKTKISEVVVCSVVPTLVMPFTDMLAGLIGRSPLLVSPEIYPLLPIKILNPNQIGTDLVANSVAAFSRFGNYSMVIDFGTALTFTTVGGDSEIRGVAIAPGLQTAMSSLAGKTAQLPFVHLAPPPSVLGDNTTHAIQSGIIYGYTGLVDFIVERTEQELNHNLTVIGTGGLSSVISPIAKKITHIDKMLTLEGLRIISGLIK
jgi:type III pantothenate kinase